METIGQAIRRRRKLLKMTQAEVADLANCSRLFVSQAESDKATLRLDTLQRLLFALGLRLRVEPKGPDNA